MIDGHLGSFVIEKKIGAGGMAVVYCAVDPNRHTQVALKVLHSHWSEQSEVVSRFKREAETASRLDHRNIVPVYEHGEIEGHLYMVMQYMPRGSLRQYFNNPARISLRVTAQVLEQVAAALDYAHQQNIVHRDLKLENVLLGNKGHVAISDFGIARVMDATRLTVTGHATGTPEYMSPEQAHGRPDVDYRSDLYSLAVMAYLMVTGRYPFTGERPLVILNKHLTMTPPQPTQVNSSLPPMVDQVLQKGLAKKPEERYASAQAFVEAFNTAITTKEATTALVDLVKPNPIEPTPTQLLAAKTSDTVILSRIPPYRRPVLWVALAIMAAAVALGGVALATRSEDPNKIGIQVAAALTQTAEAWSPTPTSTLTPTVTPSSTPTDTPTPSQTPSNTPTRTPSPTTTPTFTPVFGNAEVSWYLGADQRSGAGVTYAILGHLDYLERVQLIGRNARTTWVQARTQSGSEGWVAANRLATSLDLESLPVTWSLDLTPTATATRRPSQTPTPTPSETSTLSPTVAPQSQPVVMPTATSAPVSDPNNPPPPTTDPGNNNPPGQGNTPPGQQNTPPGHGGQPPGQGKKGK